MNRLPTPAQARTLDYWSAYGRATGVWPTIREAAEALGVCGTTVFERLDMLQRKGSVGGLRQRLFDQAGVAGVVLDQQRITPLGHPPHGAAA